MGGHGNKIAYLGKASIFFWAPRLKCLPGESTWTIYKTTVWDQKENTGRIMAGCVFFCGYKLLYDFTSIFVEAQMRFLKVSNLIDWNTKNISSSGSSQQRRGLQKFATATATTGASEIWTCGNPDAWKRTGTASEGGSVINLCKKGKMLL